MKQIIFTKNAPKPIGPYSQAIKANGELLFISGQIPLNLNGEIQGTTISEQTHQVIQNINAILQSEGLTFDNVIITTVLLKSMEHFAEMNSIYNEYFDSSKPARAAFEVARLPKDVLIEIEAVAVY